MLTFHSHFPYILCPLTVPQIPDDLKKRKTNLLTTKTVIRLAPDKWYIHVINPTCPFRASDISRGREPAKFRHFREIPRNSQKNAKYHEIRQKYFQIHVGKTYLVLILAIRPFLFTANVQIYLETSSLQRVNNVLKLPGVLR